MYTSKLISVLKRLDKPELKELKKFINAPYFNSKKKLIELYDYLVRFHPNFEDKRLAKHLVWKKLFSDKSFQQKKITDLMSELTSLVQKFITIQAIQKEDKLFKCATTWALNRKHAFNVFEEELKRAEGVLHAQTTAAPMDHLLKFLLKKELYYHPISPKAPPAGNILQKANTHLDNFFLSYKLKLILESQLRARIFSEEEKLEIGMLEQQFNISKNSDPMISIYYNLILFQQTNKLNLLQKIQSKLHESLSSFPKEDKIIIIHALINHLSHIYHSGKPQLAHQLLATFKLGLQEQIFISSGKMRHTTFLNISVVAAATNEFDLIDELILDYETFLDPESRLDTICLSHAYKFFHQGDYPDSLIKLNELNQSRKPEFEFRFRNLEIRCLFEIALANKSYWEVLFSKIQNFEKYLSRNNILSIEKTVSYRNFVRMTNKTANAIYSKKLSDNKKKSLLKELKLFEKIVSFNWLKAKITGSK